MIEAIMLKCANFNKLSRKISIFEIPLILMKTNFCVNFDTDLRKSRYLVKNKIKSVETSY